MITLKQFIYLLEGKVDDLANMYPDVPVRSYAGKDPTNTKKFLPWLVSQHRKGNVDPEHPDLASTLSGFDRYKLQHGIKDHSHYNFKDLVDKIKPLVGTASTKKERTQEGIEKIHEEPSGIKAFHIKTKEASQQLYGGGIERGGEKGGFRGTSWCTSARSKDCLFEKVYGKKYSIHDPNDDRAPYAVHPDKGTITSRFNDGDKPIEDVMKNNPQLRPVIDKINDHYNSFPSTILKNKFKNTPENITSDDIDQVIKKHSSDSILMDLALNHSKLAPQHIQYLLDKNNNDVNDMLSNNPKLAPQHIKQLMDKNKYELDYNLASNPALHKEHIDYLFSKEHDDGSVHSGLARNPSLNDDHIYNLMRLNTIDVDRNLAQNTSLTPSHIDILLNKHKKYITDELVKNPALKPRHIQELLYNNDSDIDNELSLRKDLQPHHVQQLLDKNDEKINSNLRANGHIK